MNHDEYVEQVRISLRDYFERLLDERDRQLQVQMTALEKALTLAREEDERRFTQLNELRREVLTDRSQFLPREVFDSKDETGLRWRETMVKDARLLSERVMALETRFQVWAAVLAGLIVIMQLLSRWLFQ